MNLPAVHQPYLPLGLPAGSSMHIAQCLHILLTGHLQHPGKGHPCRVPGHCLRHPVKIGACLREGIPWQADAPAILPIAAPLGSSLACILYPAYHNQLFPGTGHGNIEDTQLLRLAFLHHFRPDSQT